MLQICYTNRVTAQQSLVRIPKDLANHLRVIAIYQDRRLSSVLKDAVENYIINNKDYYPKELKKE